MRKLPQKKQWDQRNAGRTRRQPSNCLLSPEQQEMRRSAFQFTIAIPKMWFGHPPNSLNPWGSTSRPERRLAQRRADTSQRFDRCSRFDWHSFPPGVHARLAPMFAWCSYSAWRPFSPVSHFAWCSRFDWHPYQHDARVSLDDHVHLMATFRLTLMLT